MFAVPRAAVLHLQPGVSRSPAGAFPHQLMCFPQKHGYLGPPGDSGLARLWCGLSFGFLVVSFFLIAAYVVLMCSTAWVRRDPAVFHHLPCPRMAEATFPHCVAP